MIRNVCYKDLEALLKLESICFESDLLNRRSFIRWIKVKHRIFRVIVLNETVVGYGLVILRRASCAARLYSIALAPEIRGKGLAQKLLKDLESQAAIENRQIMRLEVSKKNQAAIALYQKNGYQIFKELPNYYQDHSDGWRMSKKI